jgi:hypothetical protein
MAMKKGSLAIYCHVGILALGLAAQEKAGQTRSESRDRLARVEVVAFETGGKPLGAPVISTFESYDHKNLASRFHSGVAEGIPYGIYRVEGRLPGYYSDYRYVAVYGSPVAVVLGLAFGYEAPQVPMTLRGRVVGALASKRSFVKLVGVYGSLAMESAIGPGGTFSFDGVSHGSFLILVVGEAGIVASKTLTIPYTGPPLEVEVGSSNLAH